MTTNDEQYPLGQPDGFIADMPEIEGLADLFYQQSSEAVPVLGNEEAIQELIASLENRIHSLMQDLEQVLAQYTQQVERRQVSGGSPHELLLFTARITQILSYATRLEDSVEKLRAADASQAYLGYSPLLLEVNQYVHDANERFNNAHLNLLVQAFKLNFDHTPAQLADAIENSISAGG